MLGNPRKFYRLVEDEETDSLRVSWKFVAVCGVKLPNEVYLRVQNGEPWPVELSYLDNGQVLLQKGWREFCDHYWVLWNCLEFRYDGDADFEVKIYDITVSEVEYEPDDEQVGTSRAASRRCPRESRIEDVEVSSEDSDEESGDDSDEEWVQKEGDSFSSIATREHSVKLSRSDSNGLALPIKFTKGSWIKPVMYIMLQNFEGRKWRVIVKADHNKVGGCALCAGWNKYLVDNEVAVGSVMAFKFVRGTKNAIEALVVEMGPNPEDLFKSKYTSVKSKVSVCGFKRPHDQLNSRTGTDNCGVRLRWTNKLKEHTFKQLYLPRDVTEAIGDAVNGEVILQDQEGREWPVKSTTYYEGDTWIKNGLREFLEANNADIGSTIQFEAVPGSRTIKARVLGEGNRGPHTKNLKRETRE